MSTPESPEDPRAVRTRIYAELKTSEALRSTARLRLWLMEQQCWWLNPIWIWPTDTELRLILDAAEHALAVGSNPLAMFCRNVAHRSWEFGTEKSRKRSAERHDEWAAVSASRHLVGKEWLTFNGVVIRLAEDLARRGHATIRETTATESKYRYRCFADVLGAGHLGELMRKDAVWLPSIDEELPPGTVEAASLRVGAWRQLFRFAYWYDGEQRKTFGIEGPSFFGRAATRIHEVIASAGTNDVVTVATPCEGALTKLLSYAIAHVQPAAAAWVVAPLAAELASTR